MKRNFLSAFFFFFRLILFFFKDKLKKAFLKDLLGLGTSAESIVIVRVTSSILATRFYDNLRQARHRFGLDEAFEVIFQSENIFSCI